MSRNDLYSMYNELDDMISSIDIKDEDVVKDDEVVYIEEEPVVIEDNEVIETYSKQTINTTNNRMEISAILWALENYGDKQPTIFSDSSYCVNMFTTWIFDWYKNDWIKSDGQMAKNIDLLEKFMELYNQNMNRIHY